MANSLTNIIPKILATAVGVLRQAAVMPRLINSNYSTLSAAKGSTIDIPIYNSSTVRDVAPGVTFNTTNLTDISPTLKQISLNKWKEVALVLTDKEQGEIMEGVIPQAAIQSATTALAENVNASILGLYTGVYGYAGVAGTTPFGTNLSEATTARKVLNNQKCPFNMRNIVIDPDADGQALDLTQLTNADNSADANVITNGIIGRKLGFDWYMDQQVPTHTTGTLSDGTNMAALVNNAAVAVGDTSVPADETSLTGTVVVGDVFTVAGDTQTYVIDTAATAASNAITLSFSPAAKVAWADDAAITFKSAHVVNLAFQRDAFAIASRPLIVPDAGGQLIESFTVPVTGLTIRFTAEYAHKQMNYSFDILYGVTLVRPELAVRIAG